jgi:glutathione S-transferase
LITECTAITEYLDHLTGTPTLTGEGAKERAVIHMMQRRVERNLLDAIGTYFHQATPGLGADREGVQNRDWGQKQKQMALAMLTSLDQILANQLYVAGDRFSVADITAFAGLVFGGFCEIRIPDSAIHLKAWHERLLQRTSFSV